VRVHWQLLCHEAHLRSCDEYVVIHAAVRGELRRRLKDVRRVRELLGKYKRELCVAIG
jgi:hypothetical protein